jgi:demethylmenaquinone methyltransferase / 2-methoxy-6-polyprenyl-1,4-benzoquinol methylase
MSGFDGRSSGGQKDSVRDSTHFGFREVPEHAKSGLVADVFHSVARRYDLMNDLMSLGIHRLWKQFAFTQSGVRRGAHVLDVAGGSGDMTARFALRVGSTGRVVLTDINDSMLQVGRERLADRGAVGNVEFVQADAEALPFADDLFDCVCIAFGLRNVTRIDRALASMQRVLRPGGCLIVLEFSRPVMPGLNRLYDAYSFNVLPRLGKLVANDEASYRYLVESIRRHPAQETLKGMMEQAGLERVHYFNLSGGIVALHKGYKF